MNIELNLLRQLALMQHQGEDFFIIEDKAFKGTEEEARQQFYDDIEGAEEADIDANFLIFAKITLKKLKNLIRMTIIMII